MPTRTTFKTQMKTPFRSPFWSGFASSLAAAALIALLSLLVTWKSFTASTAPVWLVLILLVLLIGLATTLVQLLRGQPRRVLVMVSAFTRFHFFSDLLRELLQELDRNHLQAVVKIPSRDFSSPAQSRILTEGIRDRKGYVGAILVPIKPDQNRDDLARFVEEFRKPVVFLDTEPPWSEEDYPETAAFVGFDGCLGGRLAAQAVVAELERKAISSPKILVVAGPYQERRQECFEEHVKTAMPSAQVTVDRNGEFLRAAAREVARQHLEMAGASNRPYDAIFCTNDAMALGVLDALSEMHDEDAARALVLVSYDAIEEVAARIERADSQLKNAVRQDRRELAEQAVVLLAQLLNGDTPRRVSRLEPRLQRVAPVADLAE